MDSVSLVGGSPVVIDPAIFAFSITAGIDINAVGVALSSVADNRARLGAIQSRIRDVDMTSEMANLTRLQILSQSGTAMLAQANQTPQSVLQLRQR